MLNNFIGGGQVFLHKVRMFRQVLRATVFVSTIAGMLMAWSLHNSKNSNLDLDGGKLTALENIAKVVYSYSLWISCIQSAKLQNI